VAGFGGVRQCIKWPGARADNSWVRGAPARVPGDPAMAKITVNGVAYGSIEAMPEEARHAYEQAVAKFPELADGDGDGIPDVAEGKGLTLLPGVTVHRKFIVNGKTYEDEKDMSAEAREAFEKAMHAASAGGPKVTKNELKMSFQITGPHFSIRKGSTMPSPSQPIRQAAPPDATPQPIVETPTPSPYESDASEGRLRLALTLAACGTGGLVLWLMLRAH
jgi:hypothetical protein